MANDALLTGFAERFMLPLIAGGDLHVGAPMAMRELDDLWAAVESSPALAQVELAKGDALASLVPQVPFLPLGRDEVALAAAVHNALFLLHPEARGLTTRKRRRILDTAMMMAAQPMTRDPRGLLSRHALLGRLSALRREDRAVTWWTGSAYFRGQPVPARLLAWPGLRRVATTIREVNVAASLLDEQFLGLVATLMRRSPLTHALSGYGPPMHWEETVFLLRHRSLARLLTRETLDLDPDRAAARLMWMFQGFEQMLGRSPAAADVLDVAAFFVHVQLMAALADFAMGREPATTLLSWLAATPKRDPEQLLMGCFLALPLVLSDFDKRWAAPAGVADDPDQLAAWQAARTRMASNVANGATELLRSLLARHLQKDEAATVFVAAKPV